MSNPNTLSTAFFGWMRGKFGTKWREEVTPDVISSHKNAFFAGASTAVTTLSKHVGRPHYLRVEGDLIDELQTFSAILQRPRCLETEDESNEQL